MATYFSAETLVIDPEIQSANFKDGNELFSVNPPDLEKSIIESLTEQDREKLLLSTHMSSRRGWAAFYLQELCSQACVTNLVFLYGENSPYLRWKLPLDVDEDDEDEDDVYSYVHGYLLEVNEIKSASEAIAFLFDWSLKNIDIISHDDQLGYFADSDDIYEAITQPVTTPNPRNVVAYSEDGDGPWYFYSWLHSVKAVMDTALLANKNILHVGIVPT
jgi:hypothetical protein